MRLFNSRTLRVHLKRIVTARKIGLTTIFIYTFFITILRAIRLPNDFAEAHWLIDYRFGFVKRGLIGTLVSFLSFIDQIQPTAILIAILSGIAFVIFCLVLLYLGLRIASRSDWSADTILLILIFYSSGFVIMSAHLFGYFDNIIVVLSVFSIILLFKRMIWPAVFLQVISILVHETAVLIGFPVFCWAWLLINRRVTADQKQLPLGPMFLPIGVFLLLLVSPIFLSADFQQLLTKHLTAFSFIQENRNTLIPYWFTFSFIDWLASQGSLFFTRLTSIYMYILVLPSVMTSLFFIYQVSHFQKFSAESITLLVVCLAPQLLHAVAWDTTRIWTYSILTSFLALWVTCEVFPQPSFHSSSNFQHRNFNSTYGRRIRSFQSGNSPTLICSDDPFRNSSKKLKLVQHDE